MKIKRKISIADAEDDPSDHEDSLQPHGAACAGFAQEATHRPHAAPRDPAGAAAQIVFCKSSGGQAEGEMDGIMLR